MKPGDEVWVKCKVDMVYQGLNHIGVCYGGFDFEVKQSDYKPVEPETVQHSAWKEVRVRGKGDCAMSIECVNLTKKQVMDILRNQGALFRLAGLSYDSLDGEGSIMLVPDDGVVKYVEGEGGK